jgi:hypothetical protein
MVDRAVGRPEKQASIGAASHKVTLWTVKATGAVGRRDGAGDVGRCVELGEVGRAGDRGGLTVGAQGGEALAVGGAEVGVVLPEGRADRRGEGPQLGGSFGGGEYGRDDVGVELQEWADAAGLVLELAEQQGYKLDLEASLLDSNNAPHRHRDSYRSGHRTAPSPDSRLTAASIDQASGPQHSVWRPCFTVLWARACATELPCDQMACPRSTNAEQRQAKAAVVVTARATFQRDHFGSSNRSRRAARSGIRSGSLAALSASLRGTFTAMVLTTANK